MRRSSLLLVLALPLTLAAGSARALPGQMTWTDTGVSGGSITFTAAAPLCPSGTVRDVGGITGIKMEHTCADGSGRFEFAVIGAGGVFRFTPAGTGRYASLRGSGSCSLTQNDDGTFTRSCHALADFDNTAPAAVIKHLDLSIARHRFNLQAAFMTSDDVSGNDVKYRLSVAAAGRTLGHTSGTTSGEALRVSVGGRLPKRARRLTVSLRVVDPLGNARTVTRTVKAQR